jgi:hypothetical protein
VRERFERRKDKLVLRRSFPLQEATVVSLTAHCH